MCWDCRAGPGCRGHLAPASGSALPPPAARREERRGELGSSAATPLSGTHTHSAPDQPQEGCPLCDFQSHQEEQCLRHSASRPRKEGRQASQGPGALCHAGGLPTSSYCTHTHIHRSQRPPPISALATSTGSRLAPSAIEGPSPASSCPSSAIAHLRGHESFLYFMQETNSKHVQNKIQGGLR